MYDKHIIESIQTWDTIADSFDKTRKNPWAQVNEYIASLSSHSLIIDLGCGNGRHLIPAILHCRSVIGFDISRRMLEISSEKIMVIKMQNTPLVQGTLYALPFVDKTFDAALCIASIHNIKKRKFRQNCFKEIYRILRSNGTALISVWSREQNRFKEKITKKQKSTDTELGDIDIYWRQDNLDIPRFYHLYTLKEFREDIEAGGFTIQSMHAEKITSQHQADNYFAIVIRRE
ncbi:MAG: class I SAM-dependent methyltransferase [Candidatus Thermoplasmatota archaeon]|nr:class I SAM-dependent methyltransferase [Candidatus Thermoplasmatota archaeon]MBU1941774.1 class I SAM-dependent methyltransferase [Candidatus Thermoplasmatota archaeon]